MIDDDHVRIFQGAAADLGGELLSHQRLHGGSSADVWRLDVQLTTGEVRPYVFRRHGDAGFKGHEQSVVRKEFHLLEVLTMHAMAVARPRLLLEDHGALVTDLVTGSTEVASGDLDSALDQMVHFLVELHHLDLDEVSIELVGELEEPVQRLLLDAPSTPTGGRLRRALGTGADVVLANEPVLLHGDFWPGNVLWHERNLAAVIDWEDATIGDPLADLACARVELLCRYGPDAMDRFTTHYLHRAGDVDTTALPLWECYVSATALASMHRWGLDATDEADRRSRTNRFFENAARQLLVAGWLMAARR